MTDPPASDRVRQTLRIPEELRAFMRRVLVKIDWSDGGGSLDGAAAIQDDCGSGGRIERNTYELRFTPRDEAVRWTLRLHEQQIRDIASGALAEIDADREALAPTTRGEPLLVWGEFGDDALRVRSRRELAVALDALQAAGEVPDAPQTLRLWSTADDQVFAVLYGDQAALYVVTGVHGYGTSAGDASRTEAFQLVDPDAGALTVPWSDCVPWPAARAALLHFAEAGELGPSVPLDGRIPVGLLHLGELDRAAELATRPPPNADPSRTSLVRRNPFAAWARRLIDHLRALGLVELLDTALDRVVVELAEVLHAHGEVAQVSPRTADRIAHELAALRGVDRVYANGGDLQTALRRTRAP